MPPAILPPPSAAVHLVWIIIVVTAAFSTLACIGWSAWLIGVYYRDGQRQRMGWCLKCGYDLTHNTQGRCPECGEPIYTTPPPPPPPPDGPTS